MDRAEHDRVAERHAMDKVRAELAAALRAAEAARVEAGTLKATVAKAEERLRHADDKARAAVATTDAMRAETEALRVGLKAAHAGATGHHGQLESLRTELSAAHAAVAAAHGERQRAESAAREATEARAAQVVANQKFHAELEAATREGLRASEKLRAVQARADELDGEVRRVSAELVASRLKVETERQQSVDARAALEGVQKQLEEARGRLDSYKLRCPKCGENLQEEEFEGITIDHCTGCDGIYFDAGEVDQLIEKIAARSHAQDLPVEEKTSWLRGLFRRGQPTA